MERGEMVGRFTEEEEGREVGWGREGGKRREWTEREGRGER